MFELKASEGGETVLGYVVKQAKARLYVYEQYRRDDRVATKHVGPLERIVEEWKACMDGVKWGAEGRGGGPAGI